MCKVFLIYAAWAGISGIIYKVPFFIFGANITSYIRQHLYENFLRRHVGWFDAKQNSAGVLSDVLAEEAQLVQGAGIEGTF
jgi:ABC-type multidrug transport system fused ATPase/permease subunit